MVQEGWIENRIDPQIHVTHLNNKQKASFATSWTKQKNMPMHQSIQVAWKDTHLLPDSWANVEFSLFEDQVVCLQQIHDPF